MKKLFVLTSLLFLTTSCSEDFNNEAACQDWIDAFSCGDTDISSSVDCSLYADVDCDVSDYFNCLTENTTCEMGVVDITGWSACYNLATCD